jgi:hypothetical protein
MAVHHVLLLRFRLLSTGAAQTVADSRYLLSSACRAIKETQTVCVHAETYYRIAILASSPPRLLAFYEGGISSRAVLSRKNFALVY